MNSQETIDLFQHYVIGNYKRYPVCLVRGEGSYVWDAEGNRYLDFFPGWGCDLFGHCPPRDRRRRCANRSASSFTCPTPGTPRPRACWPRP